MTRSRDVEDREIYDAMCAGSPRYRRAELFAVCAVGLLREFIPTNREVARQVHDHLLRAAFTANYALVQVPPEYDSLKDAEIRRLMFSTMTAEYNPLKDADLRRALLGAAPPGEKL